MRSKRLIAMVVGGIVAGIAMTGCGSDANTGAELGANWDKIVEAANEEGEVTIYSTHAPENLEKLKKAFEKAYPEIKLTYVRGTDADILPKVEVENQTGRGTVDVHMTTDAGWIDRSLATDYSAEVVGPDFENEAYDPENSVVEGKWFLTSAAVFGLGWNTDKWPEGLETPEDVLDPKLKGKIGVTNPSGIPTYVDMYQRINVDFGTDYVARLAKMDPQIYPSAVAISAALTSGEIWATPIVATTVLTEKQAGAPVDFTLPEKPFGVPWFTHVLASAPHTNAAQVLADFMVTPEGQAAISTNYISVLPDIKGTGIPGTDVLAQDIELADPAALDQQVVTDYQAKWEELFSAENL